MHIRLRTNFAKGSILVAALMLATTALADSPVADDLKARHPAVVVPATIDFGAHDVETAVPGRVWIINRDDEPLQLVKVKGSCGCIKLADNQNVEIAPHSALPFEFTYKAPAKDGTSKIKKLQFIFDDHETLSVALDIAADGRVEDKQTELASLEDAGVISAPGVVAFGEVETDALVKGSAWLINAGDTPRRIEGAKGDCGCITLRDFTPLTLAAHEARLVQFSVKTPAKHGKTKDTKITFRMSEGEPLTLPISMHTAEERVARSEDSQD